MKRAVFNVRGDDTTEVLLYGVVGADFFGDGIDPKDFRQQVKAVKTSRIALHVNSPGGDVFAGSSMGAALDEFPGAIDVFIDGLAASAASVISMSGDVIKMAGGSMMMIHDPSGLTVGTAADHRATADLLDAVREQIISAYERHSAAGREQLGKWMTEETWFDPQAAVDAGLAHEVIEPVRVAALVDHVKLFAKLGFRHPPKSLDAPMIQAWEETRRRQQIAASL